MADTSLPSPGGFGTVRARFEGNLKYAASSPLASGGRSGWVPFCIGTYAGGLTPPAATGVVAPPAAASVALAVGAPVTAVGAAGRGADGAQASSKSPPRPLTVRPAVVQRRKVRRLRLGGGDRRSGMGLCTVSFSLCAQHEGRFSLVSAGGCQLAKPQHPPGGLSSLLAIHNDLL